EAATPPPTVFSSRRKPLPAQGRAGGDLGGDYSWGGRHPTVLSSLGLGGGGGDYSWGAATHEGDKRVASSKLWPRSAAPQVPVDASVDVTSAPNTTTRTQLGVPDRSAQDALHKRTTFNAFYPSPDLAPNAARPCLVPLSDVRRWPNPPGRRPTDG